MSRSLEARIAQLEKTNRVLIVFLIVALAVLLLGFARSPSIITAQGFQLVGDDRAVRAEWLLHEGNPRLFFNDSQGVERVALFLDEEGTGLHINDGDAVTRIGVVQFAHGGGGVALHGAESRGAAVLYFKDSGSLRLFDENGQVTNAVLAGAQTNE